jgi:enoyl-CoA hydratase/carnithine racemase
MNAWTPEMEVALKEALTCAAGDPEVRAILLIGAGRAFCAGAEMAAEGIGSGPSPLAAPPPREGDLNQRYSYIAGIPKPVIAAINGATAGVGLVLSLFADIRLVHPDAKLTTAFAQRGLVAEHGSALLLQRAVGPLRAADLLLSGRVFRGTEAVEMGLALALPAVGFAEAAIDYTVSLANSVSPRSVALIKAQLSLAHGQTLTQATQLAERLLESCDGHPDVAEGVAHWLERRAPDFAPLDPDLERPE